MPPSKHPDQVCYYCGTRYGHKAVSHLSDWHKRQCDICGKLEATTDVSFFGGCKVIGSSGTHLMSEKEFNRGRTTQRPP